MGGLLVAREPELALADDLLAGVQTGVRALVLEGEPGIGKTTVWRAVGARAEALGIRVVRAMPAESEARLSYAALGDLAGPLFDDAAGALTSVQRRALAVALLRDEPQAGVDPRLIGTALLGLLDAYGSARPLVVAVDDVQWLDRASARALEFAARRGRGRVGWLLTRRGTGAERLPLGLDALEPGWVHRRVLAPLSVAALHHVLADRLDGELARPLLLRVHAASEGNPFLALELARTAAESGQRSLGEPLAVPQRLHQLLSTRLRSLSSSAVEVVRVAALLAAPTTSAVADALGDRDRARSGLVEAEDAGVLVEGDTRLRFTHPLLASAVLGDVGPGRLRGLHRRLAAVVADPEQRARHLAQASVDPDEPTAAVIEAAAEGAARRGAQDAAAELYEAAARLTPEDGPAAAARRLTGAATALLAAVDLRAARAFAMRALERAPGGASRATVLGVLARIAWLDSPLPVVVATLEEALSEPGVSRSERARLHALLAAYQVAGPTAEHAAAAAALLDESEAPGLLAHVLLSRFWADAMLGRGADEQLLGHALALEVRAGPSGERSPVPLIYLQSTDQQEAARARFAEEATWYRDRGEDGWVAERRAHLAWLELRAGNWELAEEMISDSCAVVATGRRGAWLVPFVVRSYVDVHRGRLDQARGTLSALLADAVTDESRWFASIACFVLAFLEHAAGDHEACVAAVGSMAEHHAALGIVDAPPDRSAPFHVEALLALGEIDEARAVLARLDRRWRAWPRPWIATALPRTRALVIAADGDVAGALAALEQADPDAAAALPFEAASNLLLRGQLLRRTKQKRLAAEALTEARDRYLRLGAPGWAARADSELGRTGLRQVAPTELTPSERRIVELVASGMSNPEVARAAFVSRKTVEATLARAYRKLGVRSRVQLAARLAEAPGEGGPQT